MPRTLINVYWWERADWHFEWHAIPMLTHQFVTMMTSSNGNIFRVTGHLRGEFTGLQLGELYCFSGNHQQNTAMIQCYMHSLYLQSVSAPVSLLYSFGNKTYCNSYYDSIMACHDVWNIWLSGPQEYDSPRFLRYDECCAFGIAVLLYIDKGVPVAHRTTKQSPGRHFRYGLVRNECWKKSNISIDRRR